MGLRKSPGSSSRNYEPGGDERFFVLPVVVLLLYSVVCLVYSLVRVGLQFAARSRHQWTTKGSAMSEDQLRNELRASFKNRAILYYLIFDELRTEFGEQQAAEILKRAIYRRGEQIGQQFSRFAPDDLAGLKDAFLEIIPDSGRLFDPKVVKCDAGSLVVHLEACPLKEAWEELGLDDRDREVMCEIAGEIDKGTFEAAGFSFEPDTWHPGRRSCCHLNICPKP